MSLERSAGEIDRKVHGAWGMGREVEHESMRSGQLDDSLEPERVIEAMPCWFDSVSKPKMLDDTDLELEPNDPEIEDMV